VAGTSRPESVGFSTARLQRMDEFLKRRYLDTGKLVGLHTLIARKGEVAHQFVAGDAYRENGAQLQDDAIFRIYSMTKPITSIAFMMLVEEGLVALDEPVHRWIPEWKNLRVFTGGFSGTWQTKPTSRPMLMVDLLRHTSGLTYGFQQRTNVDAAYRKAKIGEIEKAGTLDGMIAALADIPLEFSPGDLWNYSVSTDILGYLIGKITGMPFEDFLQTRLFGPLGMIDTGFHVPDSKATRLAACYALTPSGKVVLQDDPEKSSYRVPPSFISGGGGLVSTMADYTRFCKMLAGGGHLDGTQYISPKTLALMTANHLPNGADIPTMSVSLFSEAAYSGVGFGLGFSTTLDPAKTLIPGSAGDFSWGGAASTFFWVDPAEDLFMIFMTQLLPSSAYPIRRELRTLTYAAMTESFM
jgi:CubicO group peptidase (beta-lactamase class C family)